MRIIQTIACITLALALSGCTTDQEDAAAACSGISNWNIHDSCEANFLNNRQIDRNEQNAMLGAMILNRPVQTSCMNIGGIVTCSSR
jgi:hypothetical protein